jgi:hypothetical protein
MDHVMVGNYITAEQAQRKWYTNVLSKVSAWNYKIGAVRGCCCLSRFFPIATPCLELCNYHCAKSDDGSTGGREDAGSCAAWNSTAVQGEW